MRAGGSATPVVIHSDCRQHLSGRSDAGGSTWAFRARAAPFSASHVMPVMRLLPSTLAPYFPLRRSRGTVTHQRAHSTAASAVFVDEVGRRRRCMVVMGRTVVAVLVTATATLVIALASGARMSLPGLADMLAAPAERFIEELSDLPSSVSSRPAGARIRQRASATPAIPSAPTTAAPRADNRAASDVPTPARTDTTGAPAPLESAVSAGAPGPVRATPTATVPPSGPAWTPVPSAWPSAGASPNAKPAARPDRPPASPAQNSHPKHPGPTGVTPDPATRSCIRAGQPPQRRCGQIRTASRSGP